MGNFSIAIDKPWASWRGAPPEDPLGELTPWQIGIQRYLFENNHRVLLEAAGHIEHVYFTPDVVSHVARFPKNLIDLREGRRTDIDFPESMLVVELTPRGDLVEGVFRKFGYDVWRRPFQAASSEVVESLTSFITTIVDQAVAGGYVTRADADAYLANRNP
jgi:hypothetical protein